MVVSPRAASALEHQWRLGMGAGYEHLGDGGGSGLGGSGRVTYAASDAFQLLGEAGVAYLPSSDRTLTSTLLATTYVLDVLRWVPYVGLGAGVWGVGQGGPCGTAGTPSCFETRLGLSVPYGLDYQLTRTFSVGAAGQSRWLLSGASGSTSSTAVYARFDYTWGY